MYIYQYPSLLVPLGVVHLLIRYLYPYVYLYVYLYNIYIYTCALLTYI